MTANGVNVSYAEMTEAARRLLTHQQTIEGDLEAARTLIQTLVTGGFVTQYASARFEKSTESFVGSAKKLIGSMTDMGTYLTQSAQALEQVDRDLAARIQ